MLDIYTEKGYNLNVKLILLLGGGYLNNKIKELRKEYGVTQEDLAGAVGVTRQTIISLENGKYNASLQLAYKIAKHFSTTIEDVFVFEED